ncbi:MAG TPA: hypothetical protein VKU41_03545 [Polyangiaceae bacterium]|nr:hypothetical protein [Polyangiaceae bacterium]
MSIRTVALSGAVLALGALAFFGAREGFSAAVGAALATVNLWALARVVAELLPPAPAAGSASAPPAPAAKAAGPWTLVGLLKMLGLLAIAWLLMRHGVVAPLAMLIGFGALPIGIAIGSIVSDRGADAPPLGP